jgi:hypothetical protein
MTTLNLSARIQYHTECILESSNGKSIGDDTYASSPYPNPDKFLSPYSYLATYVQPLYQVYFISKEESW